MDDFSKFKQKSERLVSKDNKFLTGSDFLKKQNAAEKLNLQFKSSEKSENNGLDRLNNEHGSVGEFFQKVAENFNLKLFQEQSQWVFKNDELEFYLRECSGFEDQWYVFSMPLVKPEENEKEFIFGYFLSMNHDLFHTIDLPMGYSFNATTGDVEVLLQVQLYQLTISEISEIISIFLEAVKFLISD
jgi:hypothetical protein